MSSQNESTTNEDAVTQPKPENEPPSLEVPPSNQLNPKPSPNPEKILDRENKIVKNIICFFQKDQKDEKIISLRIRKNNKKHLILPFIQMIQKSNANDKRKEILEKLKFGIEKSTFPKHFTFRKWKREKIKKDERSKRLNIKSKSNPINQLDNIQKIYEGKYIKKINLDNSSRKMNLNHLSETSNSNLDKINDNYISKAIKTIKLDLPNKNQNQNLLNIDNKLKGTLSNIYEEFRERNVFEVHRDKEKGAKNKIHSNKNALDLINKIFTNQYINCFKLDVRSEKLEINFNEETQLEPIYREFSNQNIMPIIPSSPNKISSKVPFQKRNSLDDIFYEYTKQIHSTDPTNKLKKIRITDIDTIMLSSLFCRTLLKKIIYITFSSSEIIITNETIVKIMQLIDIDYYEFFKRYVINKRIGFRRDKPSSRIKKKFFTKKVLPNIHFVESLNISGKDNKSVKLNCFKDSNRPNMNFIDIISNRGDLRSVPITESYFAARKSDNNLDKCFSKFLDCESKKYEDLSFSDDDKTWHPDNVDKDIPCTIEVTFPETGKKVKINQKIFYKINSFVELDKSMEKGQSFRGQVQKESKSALFNQDNEKSQLLNIGMKSIVYQKKQLTEVFNQYREKMIIKKDEHKNKCNYNKFYPEKEENKSKKLSFNAQSKGNLNRIGSMVQIVKISKNKTLEQSECDKLPDKFLFYNNKNQLDNLFQKYQNSTKTKITRENEKDKPKKLVFNQQKKGSLNKLVSMVQIVNNIQKINTKEQACDKLSNKHLISKRNNVLDELFMKNQKKKKEAIHLEKEENKPKKIIIGKKENITVRMDNIHSYYKQLDKYNRENSRNDRISNIKHLNQREKQLEKIFDEYIIQNNKKEIEKLSDISLSYKKSCSLNEHPKKKELFNIDKKIKVNFPDGRVETINKNVYNKILLISGIKENEIEFEYVNFEEEEDKKSDLNSVRESDLSFQTCYIKDMDEKYKKFDHLCIDQCSNLYFNGTSLKKEAPKNEDSILSSSEFQEIELKKNHEQISNNDNVADSKEKKNSINEKPRKLNFKERLKLSKTKSKEKVFNYDRIELPK